MEKLLILSDIHANLTALNRILESVCMKDIDGIILLGDIIDYGPRSDEVIERIQEMPTEKILVNIWGNHEQAILENDYEKFSSDRGRICAQYTKSRLSDRSLAYIETMNKQGWQEFQVDDKKCLAVHGSLENIFWGSINPENSGILYEEYDYVFSGHSHIPHYIEKFYESDNKEYRNKKKTVFLNPGSVGQPRNHNPNANFATLNIRNGAAAIHSLEYDYKEEMALFSDQVDSFYKERLQKGV